MRGTIFVKYIPKQIIMTADNNINSNAFSHNLNRPFANF